MTASSALVSSSGFLHTSSGFIGASDGWTDLQAHYQLTWSYDTATNGNVMQAGEIPLNGTSDCSVSPNNDFDADIPHPNNVGRETAFTLSLGFGTSAADAENTARTSLKLPFLCKLSLTILAGVFIWLHSGRRPRRSLHNCVSSTTSR